MSHYRYNQGGGAPMIYRETYVQKIMAYTDTPFVKILTGVRRSGKSTILQMIKNRLMEERTVPSERILSYRFDSMEYEGLTAKQLYDEIKGRLSKTSTTYLFLDEVQEIEGWEKVVNSLAADFKVDIYVTGSNSHLLSSEIATYLTGRYVSFRIYTLSLAEYLQFKGVYAKVGNPRQELAEYVKRGGFPATHLRDYTLEEVYNIVRDIYNATIYTDIVKRSQIRKVDQLERVVKYTLNNVGNTFSGKSVADYLKAERRSLNSETVYNYLNQLEKAYLLHRCARYDLQGKELLKTQEKFYLADTALRYSVLGYTPDSVAAALENVVYLELCRRGYEVYIGKMGTSEIDFLATRQNEKVYIQVAQQISSQAARRREYEKLLQIKDNYPKYVLVADDFAGGNYKGIQTLHIADFLLEQAYR